MNTFFLTRNDKNEISVITSSPYFYQSSDPNIIPVKVLKLLKNDISQQLSRILFRLEISFSFENSKSHINTQNTI